MQHTLNIDLETYSSEDIKSAGLYRYAQSPDFEILLFGFSFDNAPVQVIDLACGEKVPDWVMGALYDPNVIKKAFNAAFEWYALSRWIWMQTDRLFGVPFSDKHLLPISQWNDTMIQALYCGYPGSLDGAGSAIGLPTDKKRTIVTGKQIGRAHV